jgi:hypothetical protein
MASALATIETDVKKWFGTVASDAGKFAAAFIKLFQKAPAALQMVQNFVGEVAPIVEAAVALADPIAEAPVAAVLGTIETGLAAIDAAASAAISGNSLLANLQAFSANVPNLLTGIDVKDAALQAKVESIVNLVNNEAKVLIPAVEAWVAQIKAATPAA